MDPIRIYAVWSPTDGVGLPLATAVSTHFDSAEEESAFGSIRIPVFVRYEPFTPGSAAPRPINLDEAQHNLVLAVGSLDLAAQISDDQHLASWFDELGNKFRARDGKDRFVVVSLDSKVLEIRGFPGIQAIRTYQWPSDLQDSQSETHLLLLLTNICGSMLLKETTPAGKFRRPSKQHLFISHAKTDGAIDAINIRRRLDETDFGIEPFVDANDLVAGESFTSELEEEIAGATLLALYTDAYGSRPFCRWEMLRAKFHYRPIYIVHRLKQGESRVFPYGGNAPLIVVGDLTPEAIDKILLATMTTALRGLVWQSLAADVIESRGLQGVVALARAPELVDLAHIKMRDDKPPQRMIVYPDPPLSDEERALISALDIGIEVISLSELEAKA